MIRNLISIAGVGVLVFALAGCGPTGGAPTPAGPAVVNAQLSDFAISLSPSTVPAGAVEFQITNAGAVVHEFVVIQTDIAAADLPVVGGEVSEEGLTVVDEVEDIAPGESAPLSVELAAGHYVVICNISGHYQAGMYIDLTVE